MPCKGEARAFIDPKTKKRCIRAPHHFFARIGARRQKLSSETTDAIPAAARGRCAGAAPADHPSRNSGWLARRVLDPKSVGAR